MKKLLLLALMGLSLTSCAVNKVLDCTDPYRIDNCIVFDPFKDGKTQHKKYKSYDAAMSRDYKAPKMEMPKKTWGK